MGRSGDDDHQCGTRWRWTRRAFFVGAAALSLAFAASTAQAADKHEVQMAQETLKALGYKVGTPDGIVGPRTQQAVRAFQRTYGLAATGELDASTLSALSVSTGEEAPPSSAQDISAPPASEDDSNSPGWFWLLMGAGAVGLYLRSRGKHASHGAKAPSPYSAPVAKPASSSSAYPPVLGTAPASPRSAPVMQTARASDYQRRSAPKVETHAKWIAGSEQTEVAGHVLRRGFIYVGTRLVKQSGYGNEHCLIDPTLRVATANPDVDGTGLHYWPSYYDLPPESRLAYLNWLAGERNDPSTYIGYVFLYFYGLERRLFADNPGAEASAIVAEVKRLLSVYGTNHSFNRYATALLDAASLVYDLPLQPSPLTLKKFAWSVPLSVRVGIGRLLAEGKGIPADWALAWYTTAQDRRLPILAVRCEQEFIELFRRRFAAQFPNGIAASTKKRLSVQYQAASSTFSVQLRGDFEKLPDIGELVGPLNKCDPIIDSCIRDLTDYARLIGKTGDRRGSLVAAVALPEELQDSTVAAPRSALTAFLHARIKSDNGVLSLKELLGHVDPELAKCEKITKRNLEEVSAALSRCGFGLEPDPRIASSNRAPDDQILVFREPEGAAQSQCRPEYLSALALADVGAIMAAADGVFSPDERTAFEAEIETHAHLTLHEKVRLRARFELYARTPPNSRILNRFKEAPQSQREAIARLAVSVATADGNVALEEMRALEKLYKALGLPQERLYADVHALRRDEDLPTVAEAEPQKSVPVPKPPASESARLQLNSARLAKIRADTAVVTAILGDIFEDDSSQTEPTRAMTEANGTVASEFEGLDASHAALLSDLLHANHLSAGEFGDLAAKRGLLAEGAMEVINDWAFERFGDPVIDGDDDIRIDRQLLSSEQAKVA